MSTSILYVNLLPPHSLAPGRCLCIALQSPVWGQHHKCRRSCRCNRAPSDTQRPSSHSGEAPGFERSPLDSERGLSDKRETSEIQDGNIFKLRIHVCRVESSVYQGDWGCGLVWSWLPEGGLGPVWYRSWSSETGQYLQAVCSQCWTNLSQKNQHWLNIASWHPAIPQLRVDALLYHEYMSKTHCGLPHT